MTDQAKLERAYRRLLAWYPRAFRRENGPEFLGVLMACAPDGQRRPSLAESADLIRSGVWMRLRPSVPRSAGTVRAAVRLMYVGAAVSTANLIMLLAIIADISAYHIMGGHRLPAALAGQLIVSCLVPIALWLWMARANGRGRNWARNLSAVLFGLATLDLTGAFGTPVVQLRLVPVIFGPAIPVLTWLIGLAAVWLLYRPASTAYFQPHGLTHAGHSAQPPSRIGSSSSWRSRQL
jgi:hypothetical protein